MSNKNPFPPFASKTVKQMQQAEQNRQLMDQLKMMRIAELGKVAAAMQLMTQVMCVNDHERSQVFTDCAAVMAVRSGATPEEAAEWLSKAYENQKQHFFTQEPERAKQVFDLAKQQREARAVGATLLADTQHSVLLGPEGKPVGLSLVNGNTQEEPDAPTPEEAPPAVQ